MTSSRSLARTACQASSRRAPPSLARRSPPGYPPSYGQREPSRLSEAGRICQSRRSRRSQCSRQRLRLEFRPRTWRPWLATGGRTGPERVPRLRVPRSGPIRPERQRRRIRLRHQRRRSAPCPPAAPRGPAADPRRGSASDPGRTHASEADRHLPRHRRDAQRGPGPRPARASRPIRPANPSANANPSDAYGPDDPGYGPPEPGWSHQDRPVADCRRGAVGPGRARRAAEPAETSAKAAPIPPSRSPSSTASTPQAAAPAAAHAARRTRAARSEPGAPERPSRSSRRARCRRRPARRRGPFEPLEHARATAAALSADHPATDDEGRPYEFPGLDDDEPAGSAAAALDRLKELHRTASGRPAESRRPLRPAAGPATAADQRIHQRGRKAPSAPADAPGEDRLVGFGGDFLGTR